MTMQQKMIAAWTAAIEKRGYEAVIDKSFSNVGTIRAMDGFKTVRYVSFNFQSSNLSAAINEGTVIGGGQPFGYVEYGDEDFMVSVAGLFDSLPERSDR
jgi:hypothetical protein